jgi:hypothetical protein
MLPHLSVGGADARLHRLHVVLQRRQLQRVLVHVVLVRRLRLVQRARRRLGGAQPRLCSLQRSDVLRQQRLLCSRCRVELRACTRRHVRAAGDVCVHARCALLRTCCISRANSSAGVAAASSSCSSSRSVSYAAHSRSASATWARSVKVSMGMARTSKRVTRTRLLLQLLAQRGGTLAAQRVVHGSLVGRHVPYFGDGLEPGVGAHASAAAARHAWCLQRSRRTHLAARLSGVSHTAGGDPGAAPGGPGCSGVACERMTDAVDGSTTNDSSSARPAAPATPAPP